MCVANEHDFAVLSVSNQTIVDTKYEGGFAYYNPATLFCKKCGFVVQTKANVRKSKYVGDERVSTEEAVDAIQGFWKLVSEDGVTPV